MVRRVRPGVRMATLEVPRTSTARGTMRYRMFTLALLLAGTSSLGAQSLRTPPAAPAVSAPYISLSAGRAGVAPVASPGADAGGRSVDSVAAAKGSFGRRAAHATIGAGLGLVVGAGVGAVLGSTDHSDDAIGISPVQAGAVVGGLIGLVVGAVGGALVP